MTRWFATRLAGIGLICATLPACTNTAPQVSAASEKPAAKLDQPAAAAPANLARPETKGSGRTEVGKASYYAPKFDGRTMADGRTYSAEGTAAASKTLPLGTTAKVTNLDTGRSAIVQVEDRGPHAPGRIIDVSPKVAGTLALKHAGVAPVSVKPVAVPHPDGTVTLGTGAAETPPATVDKAVRTTERLAPDPH